MYVQCKVHPSPPSIVDTHRQPFIDILGPSFGGLTFSLFSTSRKVRARETREWWPLLTVETEANGDSRVHMKGVLPSSSLVDF